MIDPKSVNKIIQAYQPYLEHNKCLMDIFEGNLLPYVLDDLKKQLNFQSYEQAIHRTFPVNILTKVIDKLTNIYQTTVVREVIDGTDQDAELLAWYEEQFDINNQMHSANELFNLCKASLLQPLIDDGKPYLRVVQNDRFIVRGSDPVIPTKPTDVILLYGMVDEKPVSHVYDNYGFVIYKGEEIDIQAMNDLMNADMINPVGVLPFVYINDSKYQIMPVQDTSVLKVVKTIPVILSDLNLAAMFQTFSILYAVDLDDANLKFAPNAVWKFKSDPTSDKKPEIGQLKPQVDIDQVIRLVEAELSMWLGTKGIRPGSVGQLTNENFASGISKVIDEMDTYEARQKQVTVFTKSENQLWDLVFKRMHPYWVSTGVIDNKSLFSPSAKVKTTFSIQLSMQSRGQMVKDLMEEIAAGFTTRELAIRRLNPEMSEEDIDQLMDEINEERGIDVTTETGSDTTNAETPEGMDEETED